MRAQVAQGFPPPKPQWGETLLLALTINGVPQDGMVRAVRLSEGLAIPTAVWGELHLRLPNAAPRMIDGEVHLLLATGAVDWHIDEASQTLEIRAPASAFDDQRLELGAGAARVTQPSIWAPYLNYDAQWQTVPGSPSVADALWELGLFSPHGAFSSTGVARSEGRGVRLDTRWQNDDPGQLRTLRLGDAISEPGAWGRALRFGGLQWGSDFSLQPGYLSFPLPTVRGEASLPSTLDVYVNNGQRLQSRVQAGAFDLAELPVVTGQGEIRTVVKDLLGREQVVVTPYYVSPALLKPGLSAYSLEVGAQRKDYGVRSNAYGPGLLSATLRRGISNRFTTELRGEASPHQQALGASGWMLWPELGTGLLSAAASRSDEQGSGWLLVAGLDRQARDWSGSVQWRRASPGFSQLGTVSVPRQVLTLALGTSWRGQSLGMSWLDQRGGSAPSRLAQLNYGVDLGRSGYVGLALFRDLMPGGSTMVALSWNFSLGQHYSGGVSTQRQSGGQAGSSVNPVQVQLQRNPGLGSDYGYQLLAESGGHQLAQGSWQGDHAVLGAGIARRNGNTEARASASGGLALLDGSLFAGRRIDGGMALVDVGGQPGVRVLQDNQVVARTDRNGRAFVTQLRGYESNRVGVEAADLPMDVELEALEIRLTPAARSASTIAFPVTRGRAASLRVLDAAGQPLPPGAMLQAGAARRFPVGLDGRSYLAGLAEGRNTVSAAWAGGSAHCEFELVLPPERDHDDLPDLGSLTCR